MLQNSEKFHSFLVLLLFFIRFYNIAVIKITFLILKSNKIFQSHISYGRNALYRQYSETYFVVGIYNVDIHATYLCLQMFAAKDYFRIIKFKLNFSQQEMAQEVLQVHRLQSTVKFCNMQCMARKSCLQALSQ